jgi:hypothetical protein
MVSIRTFLFGLLCGLTVSISAECRTTHVADYWRERYASAERATACVEVVDEVAKVLQTPTAYEFMDWSAAHAKLMTDPDLLIFPATSATLCG